MKKPLICVGALLASVALAPAPALAVPEGFAQEVEALLDKSYDQAGPGVAVVVTENGEVVYAGGQGLANIETGVPITPETQFRIGSITKQFAAAVLLQLVEEGAVSLDDPLGKYVPDYPESGANITVRQLLNHTSGIPSYTSIPGWMNPGNLERQWTTQDMIAVFKDREADFAPGERYLYNNSAYVLVGAVIEAATGKPWATEMFERISEPLGASSLASFADEAEIEQMAVGYTRGENGIEPAGRIDASVPHAAGAMRGNVLDLATWANALHGGEILSEELYAQMVKRTVLNDGTDVSYGLGLDNSGLRGREAIGHGGGINGFNTDSLYFPEEGLFVAVFNNSDSPEINAATTTARIAAMALGDPFESFVPVALDMEAVAPLLGEFRITEGDTRKFYERGGKLYTLRTGGSEGEVFPVGQDRFFYGPDRLTWFAITRGEDGQLLMEMHQNGASAAEVATWLGPIEAVPEVAIAPEVLASYAGTYSGEIGTLVLAVDDAGALTAKLNSQPALTLVAQSETEFLVEGVDASVRLELSGGAPVAAVIGQGGQEMTLARDTAED